MRRRTAWAASGLLALLASAGAAATVEFDLDAPCRTECANIGLVTGEQLVGRLTLSTAGFRAGGPVTRADVADFSVIFGATTVLIDRRTAPGYDFAATWGATAGDIGGISFTASGADDLMSPGPFVSFAAASNVGSLMGVCNDVDCASVRVDDAAILAPLSVRPAASVAPVPLPPAALLLGVGVAALAAAGRRRGRRPVAA